MKVRKLKKNKVNVITLGCAKNTYDSEVLMRQLQANSFDVEHQSSDDDASIVIINTCGFIDESKQESIDTILQFTDAKKEGLVDKVYVTGCLSERYKGDLEREIPEVDAYFGTKDMARLLKTLNADYKKELLGERLLTTPLHYAYLKISEGCDRPCSFCAIPLMRGKHISTPIENLIKQAEFLVKTGTKEIILIAQDLTYYGLDIYGERKLAELLRQLSDVPGLEWIRLHYAFPTGFPMDVLDVIKEKDNICNYLDMPLQHASSKMLKSMRRGTTKEKTTKLINEITAKVPDIAIRTTLISGYPGETIEDHEEMKQWVSEMKFDRLGVFTYSHEENTHAYNLVDDVPDEEKRRRADDIMNMQAEQAYDNNQKLVGKELKVIIDRHEGNSFFGRTEYDSPEVDNEVIIPFREGVKVGDFVKAKIISADYFDLEAELV
jgi:ribosomal protein S12 methylthiotransferase